MKTKRSIKKICDHCYFFKKHKNNKLYVKCPINPRHKQRQKFSLTILKPFMNNFQNYTTITNIYKNDLEMEDNKFDLNF